MIILSDSFRAEFTHWPLTRRRGQDTRLCPLFLHPWRVHRHTHSFFFFFQSLGVSVYNMPSTNTDSTPRSRVLGLFFCFSPFRLFSFSCPEVTGEKGRDDDEEQEETRPGVSTDEQRVSDPISVCVKCRMFRLKNSTRSKTKKCSGWMKHSRGREREKTSFIH